MDDWRQRIDLDRYVRDRVHLINNSGGRGYDQGIRIFNCPLCREERGRGWLNVVRWTAGCWNSGCKAEPRLSGALEWVKLMEEFNTRGRTWAFLLSDYPGAPPILPQAEDYEDFVKLPASFPIGAPRLLAREAQAFVAKQWGLSLEQATRWGLSVCMTGKHAYRVIVPIREGSQVISFVGRTFRNAQPKYLAAEWGIECGRHMGSLLFNLDSVDDSRPCLMVEGSGDIMAWESRPEAKDLASVGLMGTALTPERLGLLTLRQPPLIIVALDAEPKAQARALGHLEDLAAWGFKACLGAWEGGKDAGSGARLSWSWDPDDRSLLSRVRARLGV